jgi:heptosyltransferase II
MRVLIVKLHAIGDVVMCLPIVTALRRRDPNTQISWLCGEALTPLIELMGDIEVIGVKDRMLLNGTLFERTLEMARLWRVLFGRPFDLIINGYMDFRSRLLTLTTLSKERTKCAPRRDGWWAVAGRYQGHEYLRMVTKIDGPEMESVELPTFRIALSDRMHDLLGSAKKRFIAIAPGGAKNVAVESPLRRWPLGLYRSLAEALLKKGYDVLLTGGPDDDWILESFKNINVVNLVGKTSLIDLLAVYGASTAVVTHDSGPLHLALLAGARTIGLFGPTIPQEKIIRNDLVRTIWGGEKLPCRPCYDGKHYAPCSDNLCMKDISVAEVIKALEEIVELPVRRSLAYRSN